MKNGNLQKYAKQIASKGRGEDKILAHINPEEAFLLSKMFGHDINHHTGLPQFGLFKELKKIGKKLERHVIRPVFHRKYLPRTLMSIAGGAFGGLPLAMAGGAFGGSMSAGSKNKLKAAGKGALAGAALSSAATGIGKLAGVSPDSFLGKTLGVSNPSLMDYIRQGIGGAAAGEEGSLLGNAAKMFGSEALSNIGGLLMGGNQGASVDSQWDEQFDEGGYPDEGGYSDHPDNGYSGNFGYFDQRRDIGRNNSDGNNSGIYSLASNLPMEVYRALFESEEQEKEKKNKKSIHDKITSNLYKKGARRGFNV